MRITGIVETCLYADDLTKAEEFYSALPGVEFDSKEQGRHVFFRCGENMLLIFNPEHTSNQQTEVNGEIIPLHGTTGSGHLGFSIRSEDIDKWEDFFRENNIEIESEVTWPNGSVSIYFRDPAGNSLELVSPDIWD